VPRTYLQPVALLAIGCDREVATDSKAIFAESPGGGPESRLWAAVVERGQEPERLDQTKKFVKYY
jgi:hypothetical protein